MTHDPTTLSGVLQSLWERIEPAAKEILAPDELAILRTSITRLRSDDRYQAAIWAHYATMQHNKRLQRDLDHALDRARHAEEEAAAQAERYTENSKALRQQIADLRELSEEMLERLADCVEYCERMSDRDDICSVDRATMAKAQRILGLLP